MPRDDTVAPAPIGPSAAGSRHIYRAFRSRILYKVGTANGPVAQGIEQQPSKLKVAGSNPAGVTNTFKHLCHVRRSANNSERQQGTQRGTQPRLVRFSGLAGTNASRKERAGEPLSTPAASFLDSSRPPGACSSSKPRDSRILSTASPMGHTADATHAVYLKELTDDMRAGDLIEALAALRFHGKEPCVVSLDRGVRDFLVDAPAARRGKA